MPYLSVGSQNLSGFLMNRKNKRELLELTEKSLQELLDWCVIVGLQEAHSKEYQQMLGDFEGKGYGVYRGPNRGKELGSKATSIIWRNDPRTIKVLDTQSKKLTRRAFLPLGAGPAWTLPKWCHCVTFEHVPTRRRINFINLHGYASTWARPRRIWVNRYYKRVAEFTEGLEGITIIVGDLNTRFDKKWLKPLFEAGFKSLQEDRVAKGRGILVTHQKDANDKGRVLDDVLYRDFKEANKERKYRIDPVNLVAKTENNPSDHHGLRGIFDIRPRRTN